MRRNGRYSGVVPGVVPGEMRSDFCYRETSVLVPRRAPPPPSAVPPSAPAWRTGFLPALALSLAACSDLAQGPSAAAPEAAAVAVTAAATTEYRTKAQADAPELPAAGAVLAGIERRECVLHFRRATGAWSERRYRLTFSRAARRDRAEWTPVVQELHRVMVITQEGGKADTLPPRLGIRAICLVPHSPRGFRETEGAIRRVLQDRGAVAPAGSDR